MSKIIELRGVELAYPIYSIRASSLRNTIANMAVGGRLLKNGQDIIHIKALDGISFTLNEGDRLGIWGHNGAGKTTLLKVLAGIYEPDHGQISVMGRISSMIDIGLGLDNALTGRENLINMGKLRGFSAKHTSKLIPEVLEFSELGPYIDLPVLSYSSGMRTRLVFSLATTLDPDILLFDEWISTGDANFAAKATARMQQLLSASRALILATHNKNMIREICDKLLVIQGGKQVFFGNVSDWDMENDRPVAS